MENSKNVKFESFDHELIFDVISENSKVLDIGCGDGSLIYELKKCGIDARGIELDESLVEKCVKHGLFVIHDDIETGFSHYKTNSFDYVIMSETIQVLKNPIDTLKEALRVGKKVIVSFPNFAHYKVRFSYFFTGKMPVSKSLPYEWHNTPNIRVLTIKDFRKICKENKIKVIKEINYSNKKNVFLMPNLFASNSIFVIEKK